MSNKLIKSLTIFVLLLSSCHSFASDHIDGVPSKEHGQVDLTDLYAFPTPGKTQTHLTTILNLYPGVSAKTGHFSKKVSYDIFIKKAKVAVPPIDTNNPLVIQNDDSLTVNCSFDDTDHKKTSTCHLLRGDKIIETLRSKEGKFINSKSGSIKIFTGVRADPFFISLNHFFSVTGSLTEVEPFPGPSDPFYSKWWRPFASLFNQNSQDGLNVLTIAVEIDLQQINFNSEKSLIAVAAQSYTQEEAGKKVTLDKVGRPEVTNLSLHAVDGAKELKPLYNKIPPFKYYSASEDNESKESLSQFASRLASNISKFDLIDGSETKQWELGSTDLSQLVNILLDDYLVLNMNIDCRENTNEFFSIERDLLNNIENESCGGRKLSDDIMQSLYSLYIAGADALFPQFLTGVNRPYISSSLKDEPKRLSDSFPYLDEPLTNQWKGRVEMLKFSIGSQEGKGEGFK